MKIEKSIIKKSYEILWKKYKLLIPPKVLKRYIKAFFKKLKDKNITDFYDPFCQEDYLKWIDENIKKEEIKKFKYNPLISVLIPVYNPKQKDLDECIQSVLSQNYTNYEICIVDDSSTNDVKSIFDKYKNNSKIKIKYRKINGGISVCTNDAVSIANGEYIALLDDDDTLDKNALYEVVNVLNKKSDVDFVYTDEDKLDIQGNRCDPFFKPDYSPDTLMGFNYICHFSVIKKDLVEKIGGFRKKYDGAQDYDLFLRISEITSNIEHVSKVLYHWRKTNTSTADKLSNKNYAYEKGKEVLEDTLVRRKINGQVLTNKYSSYVIKYDYDVVPLVSIIILTRNHASDLKKCVDSIYKYTDYSNYEIVLVDNGSSEKNTLDLIANYEKLNSNFKVIRECIEFNFSKLNNDAMKVAKGEYIVLLNNDTKIISNDWLSIMVGYSMQKHIGAVGVKLLYDDDLIQHAGAVLDGYNVATHISTGEYKTSTGVYNNLVVPYNYSAVTAACMMISKNKYEEVNGYDEKLKVAYNDVDFCLKLRNKGYYNIVLPQIVLYHYESKSRGIDSTIEKQKRFISEIDYMNKKWYNELKQDKYYNKNYSLNKWFKLEKRGKYEKN